MDTTHELFKMIKKEESMKFEMKKGLEVCIRDGKEGFDPYFGHLGARFSSSFMKIEFEKNQRGYYVSFRDDSLFGTGAINVQIRTNDVEYIESMKRIIAPIVRMENFYLVIT